MKPKHHEEQNPANDGHDQREGADNQAHNRHHSYPVQVKVEALNDQLRDILQNVSHQAVRLYLEVRRLLPAH